MKGVSSRHAALTAGLGLLVMVLTAPIAELVLLPELTVARDIEQTVENIRANPGRLLLAIFCYLTTFTMDVVVAWALYVLLASVNPALSLLAAWFRLVYTVIALLGLFNLVTVYRLVGDPPEQLHSHVQVLLGAFGYYWSFSFIFFAISLVLLGILVLRSGTIPKIMGILLMISGVSYPVYYLKPYLYPGADLDYLMIAFPGELVFMFWLLIRGWRLPEPAQ